jgi:hypothetical protein
MLTIEEQERHAYTAGDLTLADALARAIDLRIGARQRGR